MTALLDHRRQARRSSVYGMADGGTAKAVETGGDDAAVKATFDDSVRMP